MKYLYVLTSNDKDLYYEQIYLSISSLLLYNSNACITLLTDDKTFKNLKGHRGDVLHLVQEIKVIKLPNKWNQKVRSRLIKTNMRNLVDGDFLYLDCDTIVLSPINIPSVWEFNIGAVKNLHFSNVQESPIYPIFHCFAKSCGINTDSPSYFNSGVLYVKDNHETREFFSQWQNLYLYYLENNSIEVDQVSLYKVNNDFDGLIKEIPGEWNWQVGFGMNYMCKAKIMHTFSSVSNQLHNIHFLKRKDFYLNMKKRMYSDLELTNIIKNAKTSFDEKLRIIPVKDTSKFTNKSVAEFCMRYKNIIVYGTEDYFFRISCLFQEIETNNIVGFIPSEQNTQKHSFMNWPFLDFDDLHYPKQEVGIILAMNIQDMNHLLPSLIERGFTNLCIYI